MRGELDFEAALIARVALLKGLPAADARALLRRAGAAQSRRADAGADDGGARGGDRAGLGRLQLLHRARRRGGGLRPAAGQPARGQRRGADRRGRPADPRPRGQARGARGAIAAEAGIGRRRCSRSATGRTISTWSRPRGSGSPITPSRRWRRRPMRGSTTPTSRRSWRCRASAGRVARLRSLRWPRRGPTCRR